MKTSHPEPLDVVYCCEKMKKNQIADLKFLRFEFVKTTLPNPVESLDISSATARVVPDLLKALAVLSDTTVRRSAINREERDWKSGNRPYLQVFQRF